MDDPLLVSGLESIRDLPGDREGLLNRERTIGDAIRQGRTLDELQGQRLYAV